MKIRAEKNNFTPRSGMVMVAVLFVMLFLGTLLSIAFLRLDGELEGAVGQSRSTTSLFIAEAGIERTINTLRVNPSWRSGFTNEPLQDVSGNIVGYYTVVFNSETSEPPWVRIAITSCGMLSPSQTEYSRTINAEIITANPAQFFAFTSDKAVISNGANIQNGSLYARELEFNICEALPNDLTVNQPTYYLSGYGYTVNDPHPSSSPDVNLLTRPTAVQNPVAFPGLDLEYYRELAEECGGRYFSGNATFSDGVSLEEGENGVIFAEGDIYIQGEVEDPVLVVAANNVYITGDISWAEDRDGNPVGKLGLFAKEDIYIAEDAPRTINIRAQLVADGGVFEALGTKGAKDTLQFQGSMAIRGERGKDYGAVDLTAYPVRTYNYDRSLIGPPALPYVTYIAHLDSWKEG